MSSDLVSPGAVRWRDLFLVVGAPVAMLLPFLAKAHHIDAPFFLWVAEQILVDPFDFYGFDVNWYGTLEPAAGVNMNPPLVPYFIALVALLFGWDEIPMHVAFLLPAGGASLGVYFLARRLCEGPVLAALLVSLSPLFMLSASNVMAETTMLFFYVWAVVCWVEGLERERVWLLVAAGVLIALSFLSKYVGITLVPLLFAYGLVARRGVGLWVFALLIPLGVSVGYELYTLMMYEQGHLAAVFDYATNVEANPKDPILQRGAMGFSFVGGTLIFAFFLAPLFWKG